MDELADTCRGFSNGTIKMNGKQNERKIKGEEERW